MKKFLFNITVVLVFMVAHSAHALTITPTNDANALVNAILGSGVTVTSSSFTGASVSAGLFSGGSSALGINSGIILTTGEAALAVGPNNLGDAGQNNGLGGSSALNSIISGTTFDATILDIEFTTTTGNLFFNFVFASEEYNEYVGSQYNDVFAFFLNGVNIALLPNSTPVSINNVNNGANAAFYNDNNLGAFETQYDGFTTVLTAQALNLTGTNRISIQIADVADRVLDSAVFIQGGTFGGSNPVVPEPNSILLVGTGLVGLAGLLRRRRQ